MLRRFTTVRADWIYLEDNVPGEEMVFVIGSEVNDAASAYAAIGYDVALLIDDIVVKDEYGQVITTWSLVCRRWPDSDN